MDALDTRATVLRFLDAHGAAQLEHPGGTLLAHLVRTEAQLHAWGAADDLSLAGLCHASYGTDGFAHALVDWTEREELIALIGPTAEAIVYRYASCDRGSLYPQLGIVDRPRFRDRFTGTDLELTDHELGAFVTLTVANELDVMLASPTLAAEYGPALVELFSRCESLMPAIAAETSRAVLADHRHDPNHPDQNHHNQNHPDQNHHNDANL